MSKFLTFLLFSCVSIFSFSQKIDDSTIRKYNVIPQFKVFKSDSSSVKFNSLFVKDKSVVLLFFSPDCEHCQQEITEIRNRISEVENIRFILITNRPPFMIKAFIKKFQLAGIKNMTAIWDSRNELPRFYGIGNYPSMVIYNSAHKAKVKYISSLVSIDGIKENAAKP